MLSPCLKYLYNEGYKVDIMVRDIAIKSGLLKHCPYVGDLIEIKNPWVSHIEGGWDAFEDQMTANIGIYNDLMEIEGYEFGGMVLRHPDNIPKIITNAKDLNLPIRDLDLEVFISDDYEDMAGKWVEQNYKDGFIFKHNSENHAEHRFDFDEWIDKNLPDLPIVTERTMWDNHEKLCEVDINLSFAIMKRATHRAVGVSIMFHAADAMQIDVDVAYVGNSNRKIFPLDTFDGRIKNFMEIDEWIVKDGKKIK